jgi:sugar O-acyltransferase (sialic acid O-acetyltransferase NeuD family)
MLLYGASGHGKVVIDCLESQLIGIDGIFDDDVNKVGLLNYQILGKYTTAKFSNEKLIISIGDNQIRKKVSAIIRHKFGVAIHASSVVSKTVTIGEGSVIFHKAVIQSSTKVGKHVIINTAASVDHDCVIDNFAHISPNATLCGNIKIGEGTHVGAGATIIPNIKIGKWSIIGAGCVVIKNVPDNVLVVGNPGRIIKKI